MRRDRACGPSTVILTSAHGLGVGSFKAQKSSALKPPMPEALHAGRSISRCWTTSLNGQRWSGGQHVTLIGSVLVREGKQSQGTAAFRALTLLIRPAER